MTKHGVSLATLNRSARFGALDQPFRGRRWLPGLVVALSLLFPLEPMAAAATAECTDETNFCFEQIEGSRWFHQARTNPKIRKRRNAKAPGALTLTIEDGRGSVFLNGRYIGTAPLQEVSVPSGPNDLQVRDGDNVLTWGILTVPKGGTVVAVVRHS